MNIWRRYMIIMQMKAISVGFKQYPFDLERSGVRSIGGGDGTSSNHHTVICLTYKINVFGGVDSKQYLTLDTVRSQLRYNFGAESYPIFDPTGIVQFRVREGTPDHALFKHCCWRITGYFITRILPCRMLRFKQALPVTGVAPHASPGPCELLLHLHVLLRFSFRFPFYSAPQFCWLNGWDEISAWANTILPVATHLTLRSLLTAIYSDRG